MMSAWLAVDAIARSTSKMRLLTVYRGLIEGPMQQASVKARGGGKFSDRSVTLFEGLANVKLQNKSGGATS